MRRLFKQFSFPGGIPSHVAPETPGSIHEGGELGYALVARLRRGVRQSRPDRRLRRRRRRGGDRPAGDELALEQIPQSRARRRGAADPASERLQDRQPDGAGAHPARGARALVRGYGYKPYFVEGDEPEHDASADGGDAGRGRSPKSGRFRTTRARNGFDQASALADDRDAHAQRLDRAEGGRRQADRGHWRAHQVPIAECGQARARADARRLDEELPARGAVRRRAASWCRSSPRWPQGQAAHERQSARQRRPAAARLRLPDFRDYAVAVPVRARSTAEATRVMGSSCAT